MGRKEQSKNNSQQSPKRKRSYSYKSFEQINGLHPWQEAVEDGCILYKTRVLKGGKVAFFNFALAKEMGLIDNDHPHKMNHRLEKKLLDTFNLRIINEYEIENKIEFDPKSIKEHPFMATRYLQLQHDNKQGKTSGDGRSIWNGVVYNRGKYWDVSSRGTGVTQLSPGAVNADKLLETGNTEMGYGCGQAEIEELFSSAIMSELVHFQGISTERVLCIVDLGGGLGIGVRAGLNLLRPAHIFRYLKLNEHEEAKKAFDYLVERQIQNKSWEFEVDGKHYDKALQAIMKDFARFAALLDRHYIFTWLDWDGDNVLAEAGIIDYGSVRQLGVRHDQYRYDDEDRFSTNLNEQKAKAKLTVQVFIQLIDFIKTKNKKPLKDFADHKILESFDQEFSDHSLFLFTQQIGLDEERSYEVLDSSKEQLQDLFEAFSYLERFKTRTGEENLPDGINKPAIFNVRKLLAFLPKNLHEHWHIRDQYEPAAYTLHQIMLIDGVQAEDKAMSDYQEKRILEFFSKYKKFIMNFLDQQKNAKLALNYLAERALTRNNKAKVTGNAVEFVVREIQANHKKKKPKFSTQTAMELFIYHNSPDPTHRGQVNLILNVDNALGKFLEKSIDIVSTYAEDI